MANDNNNKKFTYSGKCHCCLSRILWFFSFPFDSLFLKLKWRLKKNGKVNRQQSLMYKYGIRFVVSTDSPKSPPCGAEFILLGLHLGKEWSRLPKSITETSFCKFEKIHFYIVFVNGLSVIKIMVFCAATMIFNWWKYHLYHFIYPPPKQSGYLFFDF